MCTRSNRHALGISDFRERGSTIFTCLPIDIFLLIISNLCIQDVLVLRQVSRAMYLATKSRLVWNHLYYNLYLPMLSRPPVLEKPLAAHSDQELEKLVIYRCRQLALWRDAPMYELQDQQEIAMPSHGMPSVLVRGGRWFLRPMSGDCGVLAAYDLDSPTATAQVLCKAAPFTSEDFTSYEPDGNGLSVNLSEALAGPLLIPHIAIDMVENASTLRFNLLVELHPEESTHLIHIWQIWQVSLVGDGQSAKLKATHMRTLILSTIRADVFTKDYIMLEYFRSCRENDRMPFLIINWRESTSTHLNMAVISVLSPGDSDTEKEVIGYPMPNNRLLCFTLCDMMLFDIPEFKLVARECLQTQAFEGQRTPLWRVSTEDTITNFSPAFPCGDAFVLFFRNLRKHRQASAEAARRCLFACASKAQPRH